MWFFGGTFKFLKDKFNKINEGNNQIININQKKKLKKYTFPKYRANVEEGYGTIEDGVYEYFCNDCKKTIIKNRYRITSKKDYDLCDECFYKLVVSNNFNYKFTFTLRNEQDAEFREINNLVNIIMDDYNNYEIGMKIDFTAFLKSKCMEKYQFTIWSGRFFRDWLKNFNSYTLHKFTNSIFYKKNIYIKNINDYYWPNTSIY